MVQGDEVTCIDNGMPVVILVLLMLGRTAPNHMLTGMLRIVFQTDELRGFDSPSPDDRLLKGMLLVDAAENNVSRELYIST